MESCNFDSVEIFPEVLHTATIFPGCYSFSTIPVLPTLRVATSPFFLGNTWFLRDHMVRRMALECHVSNRIDGNWERKGKWNVRRGPAGSNQRPINILAFFFTRNAKKNTIEEMFFSFSKSAYRNWVAKACESHQYLSRIYRLYIHTILTYHF